MRLATNNSSCCQTCLAAAFLLLLVGCEGPESSQTNQSDRQSQVLSLGASWWREITTQSALKFEHRAVGFDDYEMPAIMGSGCSIIDFDRDGLLDIYLVNGGGFTSDGKNNADRGDGFFRRKQDGRYQAVWRESNIRVSEFGMGAWWGDYDADGFPDLFLTNYGVNRLYHNQGDGTFLPEDLPVGVVEESWSTAAAWCDINGDDLLDLIVVNYVDYLPGQYCEGAGGQRDFCGPSAYPGTVDRLLLNQGEFDSNPGTTFRDETVSRGFGNIRGKGLGLLAQDFNADGRLDFYIANDMEANHLWIQQSDGSFDEQADLLGTSRNMLGEVEASMGLVSGDWNEDGLVDFFVTHLAGETNTLYQGVAGGYWEDQTIKSGLGPSGLAFTSFGIANFDIEHDGDLDFLIANGGVKRLSSASIAEEFRDSFRQPNSVYLAANKGSPVWSETSSGGEFSVANEISRGLSRGDLDGDGDLDILLSNCSGPARLFANVAPKDGHHWLLIKLIDDSGNRDAIGAMAKLIVHKDHFISRTVNPYSGYLSCSDPTLHFGIGEASKIDALEVTWPGGEKELYENVPVDQFVVVIRGGTMLSGSDANETRIK